MNDIENPQPEELSCADALKMAESMCWMMLAMTPVVWWLQGPSVSPDQFVVRTTLVVLSAIGAVGLRVRALRNDVSRADNVFTDHGSKDRFVR